MAANTAPIFTLTPVSKTVQLTTVTADSPLRAGTGNNFLTLLSAGASGTRIDRITVTATGTTAACQVLLFINDGSTNWFFKELTVAAVTPTTVLASATTELIRTDGLPIVTLPSGYSLKVATTVTQNLNVTAWGGDF